MLVNDWSDVQPLLLPSEPPRPRRPINEIRDVTTLLERGWELVGDSPAWEFLPAVWPQHLCGWLPDSSLRTLEVFQGQDETQATREWTEAEYQQWEHERAAFSRGHLGLEPLPENRLWFVMTPAAESVSLDEVCSAIESATEVRFGQPLPADLLATAVDWLQKWRPLG